MRFFLPALLCLSALVFPGPSSAAAGEQITVRAQAVPLASDDQQGLRAGNLIYRGGLELSADDGRFGGFSALQISTDGRRLISLSDQGHRLSARLIYDPDGALTGLEEADLTPLADLEGHPLRSKKQADAEAMSPGRNGETLVAFERNHRIWRYLSDQRAAEQLEQPDGFKTLESNSGIEALTLLADGRLLALAEGSRSESRSKGWVRDRAGWSPLTYLTKDGFRVTGAATHKNGDVYLLERSYGLLGGVAVRIRKLTANAIFPEANLSPQFVGELRHPLRVDNFEGIDVVASPENRTYLYIISDDNFSMLQSTLLMMFEVRSP